MSKFFIASLLIIVAHTVCAVDQADVTSDRSIVVSLSHDHSDTWKDISREDKNNLLNKLKTELLKLGFNRVEVQFCDDRSKDCAATITEAKLHLSILMAGMKMGKPKKGLSFSIEVTDPRTPVIGKVSVVPVACRLSDGRTHQLLDMSRSEEPVKEKYLRENGLNVTYLVDKLTSACQSVLYQQQQVVLKRDNPAIERVKTEYPDVVIEKVNLQQTETISDKQEANKVNAAEQQGQTQYVIHNRGNKLTIEFGQHRR